MIAGRIVWGGVQFILLSSTGNLITFGIFFTRAFANAIPGIIVQLVVIPSVIAVVDKLNIVSFKNKIN
ncbi:MAG: ECF transporter S component, partial [Clostridia bacterium]|nr:ECF transporter S component [Clostridia bacterium]